MGAVVIAARYVPRPPVDNIWDGRPQGIQTIRMPVGGGFPFKPRFWQANYDDAAYWVNESVPVPPVQRLVGGGFPFKPNFYRFGWDDASFWQNESVPIPPVQ